MRLPIRILLAASFVGLIAYAVLALQRDDATPTPALRFTSSKDCAECHADVYAEWHGTHHQISFLNPEVRTQSEDFRNRECQICHLPQPVFVTGVGMRTMLRETRPDEGVDCLTCHQDKDGSILGRNSIPDAPCRPRANTDFIGMDLSASCHNQHQTTDQWRASKYPALGITCNTCHMPTVERKLANGTRPGFHHGFKGAHDTEMLKRAATYDVRREGDEIVAVVTNTGAGHNFPTEERHRAVDVLVRFVGETTPDEFTRAWRFRQPYRNEPGENTQLPAGATKEVRVPIPPGSIRAEVRFVYKLTPQTKDADGTLLEERVLTL
jgi:hypothetical protein